LFFCPNQKSFHLLSPKEDDGFNFRNSFFSNPLPGRIDRALNPSLRMPYSTLKPLHLLPNVQLPHLRKKAAEIS
jgi:hypothetical protein